MADQHSERPARGAFPSTRRSAILGALGDDRELRRRSWERLAAAYHAPVYQHVRLHWRLDASEAADVAQAFFERCLEGEVLGDYDAARGRFRTYLRLRLDHFVSDCRRAERALKRGGPTRALPLDFEGAEEALARAGAVSTDDPEARFDAEWTRSVLALALEALRRHCEESDKREHLRVFERFHFEGDVSYEALAAETGLTVVVLTHRLAYARRHFRRLALEVLRELTASEEEYRDEARAVLGVEL